MPEAFLEHTNITVTNPDETAQLLVKLFDWRIRWQGEAINGGYTVHVGGENSYLALYARHSEQIKKIDSFKHTLGLNHLGIVVNNLEATEQAILAEGFQTHSHGDYEPGHRFYFEDNDGLEFEVISYQ